MPQIVAPPKNQESEKRPIITTCPHCHYTISYTEDEVERVSNNSVGIICPQCGGIVGTKNIEPFTFPNSFYHFGTSKNGNLPYVLSDEETQNNVNIVKRRLQEENDIGDFTFIGSGDTIVIGFKFEDEDTIIVAKNYWEDSVFRH